MYVTYSQISDDDLVQETGRLSDQANGNDLGAALSDNLVQVRQVCKDPK